MHARPKRRAWHPADTITISLHGFQSTADRDRGIKKWLAESAAKK
jgi:hypothetical protein